MKNFEIKNQNGRSMIEMLGVLAIIGVLSVGGIAGYGTESEMMETFLDTCTTSEKVFCANDIPVSIDKAIIACDRVSENSIYMKFY